MRRFVFGAILTSMLLLVGVGAAMAAVRGSDMNVSTNGSYVNAGHYDFKYSGCSWAGGVAWDGYVSGTFQVTTANDHLNGKVDGYGYTKLVQANSSGSFPYSFCLEARDVTVHDSINIQVCREHIYGDDCSSVTRNRN